MIYKVNDTPPIGTLLLFSLQYDEQKLNEVLSFFKKYFNTEFIPLKNLVDINNIENFKYGIVEDDAFFK